MVTAGRLVYLFQESTSFLVIADLSLYRRKRVLGRTSHGGSERLLTSWKEIASLPYLVWRRVCAALVMTLTIV